MEEKGGIQSPFSTNGGIVVLHLFLPPFFLFFFFSSSFLILLIPPIVCFFSASLFLKRRESSSSKDEKYILIASTRCNFFLLFVFVEDFEASSSSFSWISPVCICSPMMRKRGRMNMFHFL